MKFFVNFLGHTIAFLLLVLLVGCASSPPSKFYLMSPIQNGSSKSQHSADAECVSIAIGYVRLPEYANRPQIVTRTSQNELSRSQFDLWAEPLQDTFARVMAENLTQLLCTKRVYLPWMKSIKADYLVGVEVIEMNGNLGTTAFLQVDWSIMEGGAGKEFVQRRSTYIEPVPDRSYSALVQAYSNMIGQLSRDIAEAIERQVEAKS
jgi:uncharacterized protein